ncbi:MAG: hypothetical protein P8Y99_05405 [Calditrichaceae bacterium]
MGCNIGQEDRPEDIADRATTILFITRPPIKKSDWFFVFNMASKPMPMGKSKVNKNIVKARGSLSLS